MILYDQPDRGQQPMSMALSRCFLKEAASEKCKLKLLQHLSLDIIALEK